MEQITPEELETQWRLWFDDKPRLSMGTVCRRASKTISDLLCKLKALDAKLERQNLDHGLSVTETDELLKRLTEAEDALDAERAAHAVPEERDPRCPDCRHYPGTGVRCPQAAYADCSNGCPAWRPKHEVLGDRTGFDPHSYECSTFNDGQCLHYGRKCILIDQPNGERESCSIAYRYYDLECTKKDLAAERAAHAETRKRAVPDGWKVRELQTPRGEFIIEDMSLTDPDWYEQGRTPFKLQRFFDNGHSWLIGHFGTLEQAIAAAEAAAKEGEDV